MRASLLLVSLLIGYAFTAAVALRKRRRGDRLDYIRSHGFDVSMIALISVFPSIPLSVFIGGPIIILLIKTSVIPFESTLKYKLFGVFFCSSTLSFFTARYAVKPGCDAFYVATNR